MDSKDTDSPSKARTKFSWPVMVVIKEMLEEDKNMPATEIQRRLLQANSSWTFPEKKIRDKVLAMKKEEHSQKKAKLGETSGDEAHAVAASAPHANHGIASVVVPRSIALGAWKPSEGKVVVKRGGGSKKRKHDGSGDNMDDYATDSDAGGDSEQAASGRGKGASGRPKGTAAVRSQSSEFQKLSFANHPIIIRKDCQFHVVNGTFGEEKLAILYVLRRIGRDDHMSCKLMEDRQKLLIKVVWNKFSFSSLSAAAYNDETIQKLQQSFAYSVAEPHLSEDVFELPSQAHPDHAPRRQEFSVDGGKLVYMEIVLSEPISDTNWIIPKAQHANKAGDDF